MVSRYGPVKQDGICLLPPPPHYRMIQTQRPDGFHVSTQSFVQQQQNSQTQAQGAGLRGIPPTGPPNQSSTPPNTDIKVQSVPPQSSLNHNIQFVGPSQVRPQAHYYKPCAVNTAPAQASRMANRQTQQQMYQQPPSQYIPLPMQTMYLPSPPPPPHANYFNMSQRPQPLVSQVPMFTANNLSYGPYNPGQAQPSSVPYTYYSMGLPRAGPPSQNNTAPPTTAQPTISNMSMNQPPPPQPSYTQKHKKRSRAIPIIHPTTGIDITPELEQENSQPPSGESSARQTPQPGTGKEVQATFAKQVAMAIMNTEETGQGAVPHEEPDHHSHHHLPHAHHHPGMPLVTDHMDPGLYNAPQPPPTRLESLKPTSTFNVQAKEFVSSSQTAKEPPIVSANCDTAEVTLPIKPAKDRESPAKSRKQQPPVPREHKDSTKESSLSSSGSIKESAVVTEKPSTITIVQQKDEQRPKESVAVPQQSSKDSKDVGSVIQHQREDKKCSKKDIKQAEVKVPSVVDTNESTAVVVGSDQQAQEVANVNAKSRNASRSKDIQKQLPAQGNQKQQQQQQQQQPQPPIVPPPQPAKSHSKTNKKSEINQKGANKEGTDMDVFNDNALNNFNNTSAVNANLVNNNINNDIINANNANNNNSNVTSVPTTVSIPVVNKDSGKKPESNEVPPAVPIVQAITVKPEIKTLPKNNFDITNIVKENHNPVKHFMPPPPAPLQPEAEEECDRTDLSSEQSLRPVKDETTECANGNEMYTIKDGVIKYTREALFKLKDSPLSNIKPETILDAVIPDERGRMTDARFAMMPGRDFTPPFYGGKSGSQRGAPPKRNSQSGKLSGGGGKGSKSQQNPIPKVSISLREDVKLHEVENAWKPHRLLPSKEELSEEQKKTEELYRRVRGVLNKLTPEKFSRLVDQVQTLQIDTADRLQGVINLVFEKAIDEPNFSVAYALMCKELALMQVPTAHSTEEKKEYVNFRKLLVTRCQQEFEKNSADESVRNQMVQEIDNNEDAEKKKLLQEELEEHDRRLRVKSVGNIRFIGELFKQNMLTAKIMYRCLTNLIENKDEESLECLCKLLSTVGKELETKKDIDLNPIFNTMKDIVDKKHGRVSSRVRFMLQDVIDLKNSRWVPRRQDSNPKTIEQIQKEHEKEQMNIQVMNSLPAGSGRKDDRGPGSSSSSRDDRDRKQRRNISDDGWTTATRANRNQFTVQSDKLKAKAPQIDEKFGSSQMFGNWGKGSNIKTTQNNLPTMTNMFTALDNNDTGDKRPLGPKGSRDPYSSKGPSMERTFKQPYDGRGSRSGSQQRGDANDKASHRSVPGPALAPLPVPQASSKPVQPAATQQAPAEPPLQLSQELLERRIINNLDEYVNDSCSIDEYDADTRKIVPSPSYYSKLVADSYMHVLDRSSNARLKTGKLFAALIKRGTISLGDYCVGLEDVLSFTEDLAIDIPKIWEYMPEILVHTICEEALPLVGLQKAFGDLTKQGCAARILAPLFKAVITEKGPNFLQNIWLASGLNLNDFMSDSVVENFVKQNDLGFLAGGTSPPVGVSQLPYEQVHHKLLQFFESKVSFDDIVNWITANVGEGVKENKFIRILATTIFESSIEKSKLNVVTLQGHYKLLQKYVDNNSAYELQCLYALQTLINRLEHPKGLLLSMCNQLYEDGAFSQESFIAWDGSIDPAEQEGKGVALKQLVSFFTQLKENDDDEYDGSSGSDEA